VIDRRIFKGYFTLALRVLAASTRGKSH